MTKLTKLEEEIKELKVEVAKAKESMIGKSISEVVTNRDTYYINDIAVTSFAENYISLILKFEDNTSEYHTIDTIDSIISGE